MVVSKSIVTISSVAFALLFGGGVLLYMNLGNIAKNATQRIASETLGVPVTIGSMNISIPEKSVVVKNLKIANPSGFKKPHALAVDTISIKAKSFSRELLTFDDISVTGTNAYMAVTEKGTNFNTIRQNMSAKKGNKAAKASDSAPPKVIINRLNIAKASLTPALLLEDVDLGAVTVPDIKLTGIGRKEGGVLAGEAITQIWAEISREFNLEAAKAGMLTGLPDKVLDKIGVSGIVSSEDVQKIISEPESAAEKGQELLEKNLDTINEKAKKLFDY